MLKKTIRLSTRLLVFTIVCFHHTALQAQWDFIAHPESPVTASARIGNRLFAGVEGGGLYYSDDFGRHWLTTQGSTSTGFTRIESTGPYIYVTSSSSSGDNIYQSTDGGLHFSLFNIVPNLGAVDKVLRGDTMWYINPTKATLKREIYAPAFSSVALLDLPANSMMDVEKPGNSLVVAALSGIYWSTDEGVTWQPAVENVPVNTSTKFFVFDNVLFCYNQQGQVFRSDNGGANWLTLPYFQTNFAAFTIDGFYRDDNALLVISNSNSAGQRAWRSTDLGLSWQATYNDVANVLEGFALPDGKMLRTTTGFLRSTDGGVSWYTSNEGLRSNPIIGFYRTTTGRWVVAHVTGSAGLYYSDNGADYRYVPQTFGIARELIGQGSRVAINATPDLLYSADGGTSWIKRTFPNNPISVTALDWNVDRLFYRTFDGNLHEYNPANDNFSNISAPGATSCAAALDGYLFAGGPWGIRMSADNGASWHQALQDLPAGYRAIRIFTVGSRVFVAGEGYGGLYASADYGLSWEYAGTGMSGGDAYTNNMTGSGDLLFARVDQGALLYVSDNGGQQWYAAQLPSGPAFYYNGVMHVSGDSLYVYDQFNGNQSLARRPVTSLSLQKLFGAVFFDSNHDGLRDSTELGIAGLPVYLHNGPGITLTDSLGRYTLALDAAVDTLKVHVPFLLAEVLPVAYTVTQAMQGLDFAIFSDVQDVSAELYSFIPPRPGFTQHLFLSVRNNSGELLNNIPLRWRPDPQWEILSTHPAATLVGDTLQWLLDSLPVLGIWSADLLIRLPATTPLGYPSTDIAWTTLAGDDFPANDRDTLRQTTVGSFDPNDKQVDHELLSTAQAAARAKLQYQIRFQNTGTFPAEFVRIRDTLPAGLDPSTFRLLASSHPVQVQLQAPGQLDFFFDHIDLPAKPANEVGSHGFVTFEITVGPGLVAGDSINNRAGIYFDYNQPVITQNAVTRILDSLIVGLGGPPHTASALKIYPNPARNQATIEWPENVTHGDLQLLLLDAQGHLLRQLNPPSGRTFEINVSAWPAGNYWLVAKNKTQVRVGKLVVK